MANITPIYEDPSKHVNQIVSKLQYTDFPAAKEFWTNFSLIPLLDEKALNVVGWKKVGSRTIWAFGGVIFCFVPLENRAWNCLYSYSGSYGNVFWQGSNMINFDQLQKLAKFIEMNDVNTVTKDQILQTMGLIQSLS